MQFATLEGKLVNSGGMVVKNVAGLDMAKLLIGSFGTLAAIAVVNFKLSPMPDLERSFLLPFDSLAKALATRDAIVGSVLPRVLHRPVESGGGRHSGNRAWLLAIRTGGNAAVIGRYEREMAKLGEGVAFNGSQHDTLWHHVAGVHAAVSGATAGWRRGARLVYAEGVGRGHGIVSRSGVARAGTGVCYGYFEESRSAARIGWPRLWARG